MSIPPSDQCHSNVSVPRTMSGIHFGASFCGVEEAPASQPANAHEYGPHAACASGRHTATQSSASRYSKC